MRTFIIILTLFVVSCSSTRTYNPTVFSYHIDQETLQKKPIKKVVLAPVNMGTPPPSYLLKGQRKVKAAVKNYLRSNGYEILPNHVFDNAWKQASRSYGNVYDPSTGKIDGDAWRAAMIITGEKLRKETDADAIVFADVFVHEVSHSAGLSHHARWYGVTRKPSTIGAGQGVPLDFNWGQAVKAASLKVTIFNTDLQRVFHSIGGIDSLQSISLKRSPPSFERRKKLLTSSNHIQEGIELAFHPFIEMKNYTGKNQSTEASKQ